MTSYDGLTIPEATIIQKELREKLSLQNNTTPIQIIGGADVSLNLYSTTVYAGIVLMTFPACIPFACSLVKAEVKFPYVPGYLAFREVPPLVRAWEMLEQKPDALVLDGHGIAHPRGMGIASHFGAQTGQISLGCAKKILCGNFDEPGNEPGNFSPISYQNEVIGYALRTKKNVKPVFVSPGHKIDLESCKNLILNCMGKYRIPEPTRWAHHFVNAFRTGKIPDGYHLC